MSEFIEYKKTLLDPSNFSSKGLLNFKNKLKLNDLSNFYKSLSVKNYDNTQFQNELQNTTLYNDNTVTKKLLFKNRSSSNRVIYKKVFENFFDIPKYKKVNNVLNLMKVLNENEFDEKVKKIHKKCQKLKLPIKNFNIKPDKIITNKINGMKNTLNFIRGVSNYSFPKIFIAKIKEENKNYKYQLKEKNFTYKPPYQTIDTIKNHMEAQNTLYFKQSYNIYHY